MGKEFRRRWTLATLCCLLVAALSVGTGTWLLLHADDPLVTPPSPTQWTSYDDGNSEIYLDALDQFAIESSARLLGGSSTGDNQLYSPVGLYSSLSLLAESAAGDSREALVEALGLSGVEDIAGETDRLYQSIASPHGSAGVDNSLWIGRRLSPDRTMLTTLSEKLHASVYPCDLDHEDTAERMGEWLRERTDGQFSEVELLGDASEGDAHLLSAFRFDDSWRIPFDSRVTGTRTFYLAGRETVKTEFISRTIDAHPIIQGKRYLASYLPFSGGGRMHLILPDRGITPESLLEDTSVLSEILSGYTSGRSRLGDVILTMPKFTISSEWTLDTSADRLGLSFLESEGDYSALEGKITTVTLDQFTRIELNERGVGMSACEKIGTGDKGEAVKTNELVYLILDRPFIFMITSPEGRILQIGIVNNPVA